MSEKYTSPLVKVTQTACDILIDSGVVGALLVTFGVVNGNIEMSTSVRVNPAMTSTLWPTLRRIAEIVQEEVSRLNQVEIMLNDVHGPETSS